LKGRCAFDEKYCGKDLYVCFPCDGNWYLYPHDEVLDRVLAEMKIGETASWTDRGGYSFPTLSKKLREILEPYRLVAEAGRGLTSA
jgi:hypothetical protein